MATSLPEELDTEPSETPADHQEATHTFRLQKLPLEIQILVWKQVAPRPYIHFCRVTSTGLHTTGNAGATLAPILNSLDTGDSGWRIQKELSGICVSSRMAMAVPRSRKAMIAYRGVNVVVDGCNDILCLGGSFFFMSQWFMTDHPRLGYRLLDHEAAQQIFQNFQNIGHKEGGGATWTNILLQCSRDLIGGSMAGCADFHHQYPEHSACPLEMAALIDSCPNIRMYYTVINFSLVTFLNTPEPGDLQDWFKARESLAPTPDPGQENDF
jgi:hypothetical protein